MRMINTFAPKFNSPDSPMDFSSFISASPLWVIIMACIVYAILIVAATVIIWLSLRK
jgi:hypothetical protein